MHKQPEIERRKEKVKRAKEKNDLRGQVKNTAEYIARVYHGCKFMGIEVYISAYEADPQVLHAALLPSSEEEYDVVPVTGDSDLLAYGVPRFLVIVQQGGTTMIGSG